MGKQSALVMFLIGIAPVLLALPFALAVCVLDFSGLAPVPLILAVFAVGLACVVAAKWPLPRGNNLGSLGPHHLSDRRRALYWCGSAVLGFGALLTLAALVLH